MLRTLASNFRHSQSLFTSSRSGNLFPFPSLKSLGFHHSKRFNALIEIFVNDKPIKVDSSYSIFQACHEAGYFPFSSFPNRPS